MRTATKFVAPLTDDERLRLKEIHKTDPNWRTRMRAQAILLRAYPKTRDKEVKVA